jgi:hypothetical protein
LADATQASAVLALGQALRIQNEARIGASGGFVMLVAAVSTPRAREFACRDDGSGFYKPPSRGRSWNLRKSPEK